MVDQKITEGKKTQSISSAYRLMIFEDEKGNHIVTSLPTMIGKPEKAKHKVRQVKSDSKLIQRQRKKSPSF